MYKLIRSISPVILGLLGILSTARAQGDSTQLSLASLLPEGPVTLQVMKVVPTSKATVLTLKMQMALVQHREWYLQHVKNAKPNQPLPYDERFGISKAEYAELLLENKKRKLEKDSSTIPATIVINHNIARIESDKDLGESLSKLRINLANNELTTIDGKVGVAEYTRSDSTANPVGPWQGYIWKSDYKNEAVTDISSVSLELLKREKNGRVICIFTDTKMVNRKVLRNYKITFEFDR